LVSTTLGQVLLGVLFFAAAMTMGPDAYAQDNFEFDAQTFRPSAGPYSIFTVETSPVLGNLEPTGAVILDYASRPLVLEPIGGGEDIAIIDQQLAMHVVAGVGFFDLMQLNLGLPIYFINDSGNGISEIEGGVIGDMSITPKVAILSRDSLPIGLSAEVDVTLPTGREQALVGARGVTVAPALIVDYQLANVTFATNLGVRFMENRAVRNLNAGDRFEYGLGAEAAFLQGLLRVGGELYGSTQLDEFFGDEHESPLEGILGAKVVTDSGFSVFAGGGAGLVSGVGAPEFRGFLGLRYAFMETDADLDSIDDARDECIDQAEDIDGFEDQDGCPELDNDGDGVPDLKDRCAQQAGPAANDGCPARDSDKDGLLDPDDKCPDQAGDAANDGCPRDDTDGDGVFDEDDNCVKAAGPKDNQGCPLKDADKDGVLDEVDRCPNTPGASAAAGCPDADLDGIPDADDKCPDEPGLRKDEGCPPKVVKVVREDEEIKILEKVYFELGEATLKPESFNLLQQVALILRSNPDITKIEIAGHTDRVGPADENLILSQERAQAVKTYLVQQGGIDPARLVPKGYGETRPLVAPEGRKAQADNRRVEFKILEQGEAPAQ
jgi:outer membrane protein OmpA-like peptidoglycan-associated protein